MKEKHYRSIDELIEEIKDMSIEDIMNEPWDGPHLITVDELRAAGALDVPTAWRKSLCDDKNLFSESFDSDEAEATQ